MSVSTLPVGHGLVPPAVPSDLIWRLTVDQYHEMIRLGILTGDDPVELLEGWLVTKMPKNPSHSIATQLMRESLERLIPTGWHVNVQEPITTDTSEPEPDVTIVRGDRRQYLDRHPGPQDLALIVEVADTSLQRDRGSKKRLYAREKIPVYWIVNLLDSRIEVYSDPSGPEDQPDYRQCHYYGLADELPLLIETRAVGRLAVRDLLP